jgi:hypothetical protein
MLKQSIRIEQVLGFYGVELQRVGRHQLRGLCPLPTHGSQRSRLSFSVDTGKNVWACHSASCGKLRQGRVGGNVLDLVAWMEGCSLRQAALRLQEQSTAPSALPTAPRPSPPVSTPAQQKLHKIDTPKRHA